MCGHFRVPAERINRKNMRRLNLRGDCLDCWIAKNEIQCWMHDESDSVFLVDPKLTPEMHFAYECDEIDSPMFFARIAAGWEYDLLC